VIAIEPLSFVSFRKPGPFGLTQRGPLSTSSTYFAKTTALVGLLAYLAYSKGFECEAEGLFEATKKCVGQCFKGSLRGPYVLHRDSSCLYFGEENLFNLTVLFEKWNEIKTAVKKYLEGEAELGRKKKGIIDYFTTPSYNEALAGGSSPQKRGVGWRELISHQFSNKLSRSKKMSEFVFVRERFYARKVEMFFEVGEVEPRCLDDALLPLGGDGGLTRVEAKDVNPVEEKLKDLWGECWEGCEGAQSVVVVISPLIMGSEGDYSDYRRPFKEVLDFEGASRELLPLYDRYTIKAYPLGWDLMRDCPRPFVPAVAPGSAVVGKLKKPPKEIYWKGLGLFRDLGFGTVLPLPLDPTT